MRLGIAAYLVPYMFVLNPVMVLVNTGNWSAPVFLGHVLLAVGTAIVGMVGLATGATGYFRTTCNPVERLLLIASGLMMVHPGTMTDIIGVALFAAMFVLQGMKKKKAAA